jgi:micrococcal nuclease
MGRLSPLSCALLIAAACGSAPAPTTLPDVERGRLVEPLDGDSFRADVAGERTEVRLVGINAPEGDECHGDRAALALADLLSSGFTLVGAGAERDRFGRLLRYAEVDGRDVGETLLTNGHAVALHSDHRRDRRYRQLAEGAWRSRRGMWAIDACGPPTDAAVVIDEIQYDPPGPDDEQHNEEWVVIALGSGEPVELGGWTLRDESSQHRFTFPEGVLAPGAQLRVRSGCGPTVGEDLHWCAGDPVWNNGGDTVILQDAHGNVVDRRSYPDEP